MSQKKQRKNRMRIWLPMLLGLILILITPGLALAETATETEYGVAEAVEQTWLAARGEIQTVVNRVVFPVIDLVLAVLLFVKISMAYMDYRKRGQFEWTGPAILLFTLVFSLTAPLYIWYLI